MSYPGVTSMLAVRGGETVLEWYEEGTEADVLRELRSMTKVVTTTLVGIAIAEGYLRSVEQQVAEFFPGYEADVTLRELLTMTSGIDFDDAQIPELLGTEPNWTDVMLRQCVDAEKGFRYKGVDMHLLSVILTKVTGRNALKYAEEKLFGPLGIETCFWPCDPQGHSNGSTGLKMTTGDLAKLGRLFLQKGRWDGKQVVPEAWVEQATRAQSGHDPRFGTYGYAWWVAEEGFLAAGAAGQYIRNLPGQDLTLVVTSDPKRGSHETVGLLEALLERVGA